MTPQICVVDKALSGKKPSVIYRLYNHIQLSSNLMSGCDYSLFKVTTLVLLFANFAPQQPHKKPHKTEFYCCLCL